MQPFELSNVTTVFIYIPTQSGVALYVLAVFGSRLDVDQRCLSLDDVDPLKAPQDQSPDTRQNARCHDSEKAQSTFVFGEVLDRGSKLFVIERMGCRPLRGHFAQLVDLVPQSCHVVIGHCR
jgi:hypothetical protein